MKQGPKAQSLIKTHMGHRRLSSTLKHRGKKILINRIGENDFGKQESQ
jgi:hypothetical protein